MLLIIWHIEVCILFQPPHPRETKGSGAGTALPAAVLCVARGGRRPAAGGGQRHLPAALARRGPGVAAYGHGQAGHPLQWGAWLAVSG